MKNQQYEETLLGIYNLCELYTSTEEESDITTFFEERHINLELLNFYEHLLIEFMKKAQEEIEDCELKKTYMSGSIVPPPKINLVITREYMEDISSFANTLQNSKELSHKNKIYLSYNLELSALIAFKYQLKWSIAVIDTIKTNTGLITKLQLPNNDN